MMIDGCCLVNAPVKILADYFFHYKHGVISLPWWFTWFWRSVLVSPFSKGLPSMTLYFCKVDVLANIALVFVKTITLRLARRCPRARPCTCSYGSHGGFLACGHALGDSCVILARSRLVVWFEQSKASRQT